MPIAFLAVNRLALSRHRRPTSNMIVTHTQNARGERRIYLGGKGSLECWIEPKADGTGWGFHMADAVTGNALNQDDKRTWATHMLLKLAEALDVAPDQLAATPFEAIAGLHMSDPFAGCRVPSSKRKAIVNGYLATAPDICRPQSDFEAPRERAHQRQI